MVNLKDWICKKIELAKSRIKTKEEMKMLSLKLDDREKDEHYIQMIAKLKKEVFEKEEFITKLKSEHEKALNKNNQDILNLEQSIDKIKHDYREKMDRLLRKEEIAKNKLKDHLTKEHERVVDMLQQEKIALSESYEKKHEQLKKELDDKHQAQLVEWEAFIAAMNRQIVQDNLKSKEEAFNLLKDSSMLSVESHEKIKTLLELKEKQLFYVQECIQKEMDSLKNYHSEVSTSIHQFTDECMSKLKNERERNQLELEMLQKTIKEELNATNLLERKEAIKKKQKEKKELFIKKYHLTKLVDTYNKYPLALTLSGGLICLLIITSIGSSVYLSNQYHIKPKHFINSIISDVQDYDSFQADTLVYFEGNDQIVSTLKDYTFRFTTKKNKSLNEQLESFVFNYKDKDFKWERFVKNDLKILKTPYEPQYVHVNNFEEQGFAYNENALESMITNLSKKVLSLSNKSNFNVIDKQVERDYVNNKFLDYLLYYFSQIKESNYYYDLTLEGDAANKVFKDLLFELEKNENINSFFEEELVLQDVLNLEDAFIKDFQKLLNDLHKNVQASQLDINLSTNYATQLNTINLSFSLNLNNQDEVIPFKMNIMHSYSSINEVETIEQQKFTINSIPFEQLSPRIDQGEFTESPSSPFLEETSTLKDFEENNKDKEIRYTETIEQEKQEPITPNIEVEVETSVDLLNP